MIPLGDDNSLRKTTPIVTWVLILLNFLMFFLEISGGEPFIMNWAFIPSRFLANPASNLITVLTAMFMHAGWAHLLGNMLYLWIFGDNVEDRVGKLKFILFYLASGAAATFAQMFFDPTSSVPNLGASGAIAGVLGAYILFFPSGKVKVMLGYNMIELSALIVIGFWFLLQFWSGFATTASAEPGEGGVAYMAHIGGFIAGLAVAFLLRAMEKKKLN